MPQYVRKTTVSAEPVQAAESQTVEYVIYFLFGVIEVLLLFRTLFKLAGANPGSGFVSMVYSLTSLFILPFRGIFPAATGTGVVTTAVLEPATLVAIAVYAVLAWGIVALVRIIYGEEQD